MSIVLLLLDFMLEIEHSRSIRFSGNLHQMSEHSGYFDIDMSFCQSSIWVHMQLDEAFVLCCHSIILLVISEDIASQRKVRLLGLDFADAGDLPNICNCRLLQVGFTLTGLDTKEVNDAVGVLDTQTAVCHGESCIGTCKLTLHLGLSDGITSVPDEHQPLKQLRFPVAVCNLCIQLFECCESCLFIIEAYA